MTLLCNAIVYLCAGNVWFYTKEINMVNIREKMLIFNLLLTHNNNNVLNVSLLR